jgi:hypothetical protein
MRDQALAQAVAGFLDRHLLFDAVLLGPDAILCVGDDRGRLGVVSGNLLRMLHTMDG